MQSASDLPPHVRALRAYCLAPHFRGKSRTEHLLLRLLPLPRGVRRVRLPNGIEIELDWDRPFERNVVLYDSEPDVVRVLHAIVRPGDSFYDCGASLGYLSLIAARLTGPDGRVYAVEPSPETHQRLIRNVRWNDAHNIEVLPFALGEHAGRASIYRLEPLNPGMDSLVGSGDAETLGEVQVVALDELSLRPPDLVKIDTEGSEIAVLKGARRSIVASGASMIIELSRLTQRRFGYEPEDVVGFVRGLGDYRIEWLYLGRRVPVDPKRPLPHYARLGSLHGANYLFTLPLSELQAEGRKEPHRVRLTLGSRPTGHRALE